MRRCLCMALLAIAAACGSNLSPGTNPDAPPSSQPDGPTGGGGTPDGPTATGAIALTGALQGSIPVSATAAVVTEENLPFTNLFVEPVDDTSEIIAGLELVFDGSPAMQTYAASDLAGTAEVESGDLVWGASFGDDMGNFGTVGDLTLTSVTLLDADTKTFAIHGHVNLTLEPTLSTSGTVTM